MPREVERKFLVKNRDYRKEAGYVVIRQGFLNRNKKRVVRVRVMGEKAYLTIKGLTTGASRMEFEYPIPKTEAVELLENLCEKPMIEKRRYILEVEEFTWEVDEFLGDNEGLIVAEIELEHEEQNFPKPAWLGEEVTYEPKYYNANLINKPFNSWK